ncbi:hypothetical protein D3C75_1261510 [compost metagenome]
MCADGATDPVGGFGGEGVTDHATDVISAEDAGGKYRYQVCHVVHLWGAPISRACRAGSN